MFAAASGERSPPGLSRPNLRETDIGEGFVGRENETPGRVLPEKLIGGAGLEEGVPGKVLSGDLIGRAKKGDPGKVLSGGLIGGAKLVEEGDPGKVGSRT